MNQNTQDTLPPICFKVNDTMLEVSLQKGKEDLHHKLLSKYIYAFDQDRLLTYHYEENLLQLLS